MRTEKINDMWVVAQFECVIPSAEESALLRCKKRRFLVAPLLGMTGEESPFEATSQERLTGIPLWAVGS